MKAAHCLACLLALLSLQCKRGEPNVWRAAITHYGPAHLKSVRDGGVVFDLSRMKAIEDIEAAFSMSEEPPLVPVLFYFVSEDLVSKRVYLCELIAVSGQARRIVELKPGSMSSKIVLAEHDELVVSQWWNSSDLLAELVRFSESDFPSSFAAYQKFRDSLELPAGEGGSQDK